MKADSGSQKQAEQTKQTEADKSRQKQTGAVLVVERRGRRAGKRQHIGCRRMKQEVREARRVRPVAVEVLVQHRQPRSCVEMYMVRGGR